MIPSSPSARVLPVERTHHGDTFLDAYAWIGDLDDPATRELADAEEAYTEARTADQAGLRATILAEITARTLGADLSLPVRKNGYWYYRRTVEGGQYEIHCRRPAQHGEQVPTELDGGPAPDEQVLLDGDAEAGDSEYFSLGALDVSPDGALLAYSVDRTGEELFTLHIKDLSSDTLLADVVTGVYYGSAWSRDGSVLFYLRPDAAGRPFQVWRHAVGTKPDEDVLVLEEPDERYWLGMALSRSEECVVVEARSVESTETHLIDTAAPTAPPRLVAARRDGIDYTVEPDSARGRLLILHNDGAEDFALSWTPWPPDGAFGSGNDWNELLPHRPGDRLMAATAFAGGVVVTLRERGQTVLRVLPGALAEADAEDWSETGAAYDIRFPQEVHTLGLDHNLEYDTETVRVRHVSLATPEAVYDFDLAARELTLRKQAAVLGGFDPDAYEQHREWAVSSDGTLVPISLVCRRGTPRDGSAPALLSGYGAYEACPDPRFSVARLSLLDRGFVVATAHVRGGGELGRAWYTAGKLRAKENTFADFEACARHLAAVGWTSADRLVARGASAGGLTVAVLAGRAPDAVAGVIAVTPFVDPLTTLLDPTLPLTVPEWEEWGNPVDSAEDYANLRAYSPYENAAAQRYPAILAVAADNDVRVRPREPLRWISRLRAVAPDGDYLLHTESGAGHFGRSGRFDAWASESFILAWAISLVAPQEAVVSAGADAAAESES